MLTILYGRFLNVKRNWLPYGFIIILPLILMLVFGAMMDGQDNGILLPVTDLDETIYSQAFVKELKGFGTYDIRLTDESILKERVMENEAEVGLIIPKGFGDRILKGTIPQLSLFITQETQTAYSLQGIIIATVQRLAWNTAIVEGTVEAIGEHIPLGDEGKQRLKIRVSNLTKEEWTERLPIKIVGSIKGDAGDREDSLDTCTQASIGFIVAFSMFTIIFAVGEMLEEKRFGVWDRISISPVSRIKTLTGGLVYAFILGMINMMIVVIVGDLVLGINWLGHLGGVMLILMVFCFCTVSFGFLLSSIIKTHQQLQVMAPLMLVSSAMLGGCYWPLEIVKSKALHAAAKIVPAGWAMQALKDIIIYNKGIKAAYLPATVMLLMGVVFFGVAVQLIE